MGGYTDQDENLYTSDEDSEFSFEDSLRSPNPNQTLKDNDEVKSTSAFDNLGLNPAHLNRLLKVHNQVMKTYSEKLMFLEDDPQSLEEAMDDIMSYTPGTWIEYVGQLELNDYIVPPNTSMLLVGLKGSGKSHLVNRISRFFEDDEFAPERAQVSYDLSEGNLPEAQGTQFIHEYMIPTNSDSFSFYDTRGLSMDSAENYKTIKRWMSKGVRHGEPDHRDSDSSRLWTEMKHKARRNVNLYGRTRRIDFVIFVVNAASVLKSIDDENHNNVLASAFNCPFLSFRDDKPVVVMTHSDLLSLSERADVRIHLSQLFRINPMTQIFDIPENKEPTTRMAIVEMLRYSLERADRNFCVSTFRFKSYVALNDFINGAIELAFRCFDIHLIYGLSILFIMLLGILGCLVFINFRLGFLYSNSTSAGYVYF